MKFDLKILESNSQINKSILDALIPEVNNYLKQKLQNIKENLPTLIIQILSNTETYTSLISGQLQYEFGIPDPQSKLDEILNLWANNIMINYKAPTVSSSKLKASFSVSIIRSDFADVLSKDSAFVIDSLRGYNLPWLEWLLLEGNKTIIKNQQVVIRPSKFSRTGMAIMQESNTSWKVPSQYSGTINNNWITRAIDDNETLINSFFEKVFES